MQANPFILGARLAAVLVGLWLVVSGAGLINGTGGTDIFTFGEHLLGGIAELVIGVTLALGGIAPAQVVAALQFIVHIAR